MKYTKEILEPLVKRSKSWKDFIENKLGLVYCNGSKQSFYKILKKIDINYNHFSDTRLKKSSKYKNEELFTTNSIIDRTIIRSRIIKENLKEYKCHNCGCSEEWLGKKMPLILDHQDGIRDNNELNNLRFLCPNCDSIQSTYKNRNKFRPNTKQKIYENIKLQLEKQNIKQNKNSKIIEQILNSNINFTEYGWRIKMGKILNLSPQ